MTAPRFRRAARLIIVDGSSAVLLVRYAEWRAGRGSSFWATPGGGIEPGEAPLAAAVRELREETGLSATIGSKLFSHLSEYELPSGPVVQEEDYFLVELSALGPHVRNSSREPILEHRWWRLGDLRVTEDTVYPEGLAERLIPILGSGA